MKKTKRKRYPSCPSYVKGDLEISKTRGGVLISGNPAGLRSLARILVWLADVDQEQHPSMPDCEREHTHLYAVGPYAHLTHLSVTTELCRLDAKGTGDYPDRYAPKRKKPLKRPRRASR